MGRFLLGACVFVTSGCGLVVGLRTDYELGDASLDGAADAPASEGSPDASSDAGADAPVECKSDEIACTFCQIDGGPVLAHNCQKHGGASTICIAPPGWDYCSCSGPATCPDAIQVCFGNSRCRSCGEKDNPAKSTDGLGCKDGKTCAASDGGCF